MVIGSVDSTSQPLANVKLENSRQDQEEKVAAIIFESIEEASPDKLAKIRQEAEGYKLSVYA